jgi:hypothetical protein
VGFVRLDSYRCVNTEGNMTITYLVERALAACVNGEAQRAGMILEEQVLPRLKEIRAIAIGTSRTPDIKLAHVTFEAIGKAL